MLDWKRRITLILRGTIGVLLLVDPSRLAFAEPPVAMYLFPAGGQRGTDVTVRVGGLYFHQSPAFVIQGSGVTASPEIQPIDTVWFEGPVIPLPDSQQAEDYPKDYAGRIRIDASAPGSARAWRVWTSQGVTAARTFLLGDLPEVVENETDGRALPVEVTLPVTINGRIFPREDVDLWSFAARQGDSLTCTVLAASLGSPLEAHLEIRDPADRPIAESAATPLPGCDASVRFTAPVDGIYQVRIHDLKFGGLQHYVYRLTLTNGSHIDRTFPLGGRRGSTTEFLLSGQHVPASPVPLQLPIDGNTALVSFRLNTGLSNPVSIDLDEFPEVVESNHPADSPAGSPQRAPFVANGRIVEAGESDDWPVVLGQGESIEIETRAARLNSPIDTVLSVLDLTGKELQQNDDLAGNVPDSKLQFAAPTEGTYHIRVRERDADRAGESFAYRLRVAAAPRPDFRVILAADALAVPRGGEAKLKLRAERFGGFQGEIPLELTGLPQGVVCKNPAIPANAAEVDLTFTAEPQVRIQAARLEIRGTALVGDQMTTRQALLTLDAAGRPTLDHVLLTTTVPTPFKVKGVYEVKYAQRGSRFVRRFALERGNYDGPLVVQLADRQMRHLQGVTGPAIEVPAGATEFDYPIFLPPWMEIGRTSRTVVMAVGKVTDSDGTAHTVSFSSAAQNEQIVALVDPGQLSIDVGRKTQMLQPGQSVSLPVRVERGTGVSGEARVELVVPRHIRGVTAEPLLIAASESTGTFTLQFDDAACGPFNQPLTVRATVLKDGELPFVAEAKLEIVPGR